MVPADEFYARALRYVRREHPDTLAWAKRLTPKTFRRMKASTFLTQYVWCVYAAGFRVAVLDRKFPALRTAFADFDLPRLARMRSTRAALRVIGHERKAESVLRGARAIAAEGFSRFKKRVRKEGPVALAALPGIGPITKDHLARNIGLANVAKDDIWIRRVRTALGFSDKEKFAARLAARFHHRPGVIDVVIWLYCADAAWKADGFSSLRTACRGKLAQQSV
jgi:hypothetical protein